MRACAASLFPALVALLGACAQDGTSSQQDAGFLRPNRDAQPQTDLGAPDVGALDTGLTDDTDGGTDGDAIVDAGEKVAIDCHPGTQGAFRDQEALHFALSAQHATRVEVWLYSASTDAAPSHRLVLQREGQTWRTTLPFDAVTGAPRYYGYRLWGPNWPFDPSWRPGSELGFLSDVDEFGNRFNPNKLLVDPYALELSHDPLTANHDDMRAYTSGEARAIDTAPFAPKGLIIDAPCSNSVAPQRHLKDEVIYEVHLRGLTMNDQSVPESLRGTYAGAALKAPYLAQLGITAVEFLPLHETQNDRNDLFEGTGGDNYWGYSSLSFFAPDRRYASDRSPGGPTRELREMIEAFHAAGLKVYVDVVYNHTGEGHPWTEDGLTAALLSWRGIDNQGYYQPSTSRHYVDNNGVGPNLRVTRAVAAQMVLDSLVYWHKGLGVDGFRFDLASVLGNSCDEGCFNFEGNRQDGLLRRIADTLPGADLIAEPWGIGQGTYQVGGFPKGWAEWNGQYRDRLRSAQNQLGAADTTPVTPGWLSAFFHGSSFLYRDDGRAPWHSINFIVAHDGLTLKDLYSCNDKNNGQPWPYGPSDGGSDDNRSWDNQGDPMLQRQAARTGMGLLAMSFGVPMITGGDEMLRSLRCNNNPYNLDSIANWLDYTLLEQNVAFFAFTSRLFAFRAGHPALRPEDWLEGQDVDNDGVKDITWFSPSGEADGAYMDATDAHYLGWRLDVEESTEGALSIYIGYNRGTTGVRALLPAPRPGTAWHRVCDSAAWFEPEQNCRPAGVDDPLPAPGTNYDLAPRSMLLLIER